MKKIAEYAPVVLFSIDKDMVFTMSEGKGLRELGLKPGQVVGQSAKDVYKDAPDVIENISKALNGQETVAMLKVGAGIFQTTMAPIRNEKDEVTGLVGVATDVTELELAKKALEEKNEELNKVLGMMVGREKKMIELKERLRGKTGGSDASV